MRPPHRSAAIAITVGLTLLGGLVSCSDGPRTTEESTPPETVAMTDGQAADQRTRTHTAGQMGKDGIHSAGTGLVDPDRLLRSLRDLSTDAEREEFLVGIIPAWVDRDPDACIVFIATELEGAERNRWLVQAFRLFAEKEPEAAAGNVNQFFHPATSPDLYADITSQWVKHDPQKAVAWARMLGLGDPEAGLLHETISAWAAHDPTAALTYLTDATELDDGVVESAIRTAARTLAEQDGRSAVEWALQQQAQNGEGDPVAMTVSAWAATDPRAAARYAVEEVPTGYRAVAVEAVALGWTESDPAAVLAWASGLPPDTPGADEAITVALQAIEEEAEEE